MRVVSERLRTAARLSTTPIWKVAWDAGIPPSTAYKLLRGIQKVEPDDKRLIALGERLGVPPEACIGEDDQ